MLVIVCDYTVCKAYSIFYQHTKFDVDIFIQAGMLRNRHFK